MSAGTLATWIAMAFACAAAWGGWRGTPEFARRALAMCGLFAGVATIWLARSLWAGDLAVGYVVRHTILADVPLARVVALLAEPSGAALFAAAGLSLAATIVRGEVAGVIGALAAIMLAAPVSGAPLALLPFLPADGASTTPFFAHPLALAGGVAMLLHVVAACLALAHAVAPRGNPSAVTPWLLAAVAGASAHALAWMAASVASGANDELQVLLARDGGWLTSVLVTALALRITVHGGASRAAAALAALAAVLAALATLLTPEAIPRLAWPASVVLVMAMAVLTRAVWLGFPFAPTSWRGRIARIGVVFVLACTALLVLVPATPGAPAVRFARSLGMVTVFSWSLLPRQRAVVAAVAVALAGGLLLPWGRGTPFVPFLVGGMSAVVGTVLALRDGRTLRAMLTSALAAGSLAAGLGSVGTRRVVELAPGGVHAAGGGTIAHQGVSTWAEGNTTVLAVALERTPGAIFRRAEQREFADARGAILSPVWRLPATFVTPTRHDAVWLDDVHGADVARVQVASVPGQWLWVVALLAVALAWAAGPSAPVPPAGGGPARAE